MQGVGNVGSQGRAGCMHTCMTLATRVIGLNVLSKDAGRVPKAALRTLAVPEAAPAAIPPPRHCLTQELRPFGSIGWAVQEGIRTHTACTPLANIRKVVTRRPPAASKHAQRAYKQVRTRRPHSTHTQVYAHDCAQAHKQHVGPWAEGCSNTSNAGPSQGSAHCPKPAPRQPTTPKAYYCLESLHTHRWALPWPSLAPAGTAVTPPPPAAAPGSG